MCYNDGVVASSRNAFNDLVGVPVKVEMLSVITFAGPRLEEHEAGFGRGCKESRDIRGSDEGIAQPVLGVSALFRRTSANRDKRAHQACETATSGAATNCEGAKLKYFLVYGASAASPASLPKIPIDLGTLESELTLQQGV